MGGDAYEQSLDAGNHPADILPLHVALNAGVENPRDVKHPNMTEWNHGARVGYVSWLAEVVLPPGTKINQDTIDIAARLGAGPSFKQLTRYDDLSELYQEAGIQNVYKRGVYDSWTRQDFAAYVGGLARKTPKNESLNGKINELAKDGKGPSKKVISRRTGSISQAMEMDGLIDAKTMDRDGYIEWGVKFYLANPGIQLDTPALDFMSPQRLSPSRSGIVRNFGSLESFRLEVEPLYKIRVKEIAEQEEARFREITNLLVDGSLPPAAIVGTSNQQEMSFAAAQYQVLRKLFPEASAEKLCGMIRKTHESFIRTVRTESDQLISAADVEVTASVIGVFDYIWPFDEYKRTLRLPESF